MIDHTYDAPSALFLRPSTLSHRFCHRRCGWLLLLLCLVLPQRAQAGAAPDDVSASLQAVQNASTVQPAFGRAGEMFVQLTSESLFQGIWALGFEHFFGAELTPSVGYFFTDQIYARLAMDLALEQFPKATQDAGDIRTLGMAVAPSVGYTWHLHPKISVAPWVGVGLGRVWRSVAYSGYRSTVDVRVGAPFVFDFAERVSFVMSPTYKQLVYNRETFPESARMASLGGRFGMEMGAVFHW